MQKTKHVYKIGATVLPNNPYNHSFITAEFIQHLQHIIVFSAENKTGRTVIYKPHCSKKLWRAYDSVSDYT